MNEKTIQCLPNPSQHVPIYLEQLPSYSNRKCKKSLFLRKITLHLFIFCLYLFSFLTLISILCIYTMLWWIKLCVCVCVCVYRSPHFCFPWRRSYHYHAICCMDRKTIFNACQTPRSMYLFILNSFRVIRCLSQCVSPKLAIFYHIFVSPGDAPGAITLSVVWMEREFHAYKLSRCMCPSNYNPFWDTARYLWKNRHFIIPPCIWRPR